MTGWRVDERGGRTCPKCGSKGVFTDRLYCADGVYDQESCWAVKGEPDPDDDSVLLVTEWCDWKGERVAVEPEPAFEPADGWQAGV